jgi:hypothetical protein
MGYFKIVTLYCAYLEAKVKKADNRCTDPILLLLRALGGF